jgi:tetratricopeptide (TPR) repeat protein
MYDDARGIAFTAASQQAVDSFDASVEELMGSGRDVGLLLKKVAEVDPGMVMGQVLRGYFLRLPAQPQLAAQSLPALAEAERLAPGATARELKHVAALAAWCRGDIAGANRIWDDILLDHPLDLLALRVAHTMHFFLGDLARMRDSMTRVMPYWTPGVPGYGYVLGCHAFALEENNHLGEAERLGKRAVELNEADIWAGHCVAHVLEAEGRRTEGIAWVNEHQQAWARRGRFANHMWWHRALHYLEFERYDDVLAAYDRELWPAPSEDNTDFDNASSTLMRLAMLGIDVGERWQSLVDAATVYIGVRLRPFNDLHYIMALAMSGRLADARAMLASMQAFRDAHLDNIAADGEVSIARVYDQAAIPIAEATIAYATRDYETVVRIMQEVRYRMIQVGGSWTQRDVWIRMLIDAATKAGRDSLARALLAERTADRPSSAPSWKLYAAALERCGEAREAAAAREKARALLA